MGHDRRDSWMKAIRGETEFTDETYPSELERTEYNFAKGLQEAQRALSPDDLATFKAHIPLMLDMME